MVPRSTKRKDSETASSRMSVIEARKSVHLGDGSEFEVVPDLTNFTPVTLTVSSFFKQVHVQYMQVTAILFFRWWSELHFGLQ